MDIAIKPKNYDEAFHFYILLPFYGVKQCLLKKEIIFKQDEIVDIRLDISKSHVVAFSYSKDGFEGIVGMTRYSEKLYAHNFPDKKIAEGLKTHKEILKHFFFLLFNKHSPPLWSFGLTIAVTVIFYFLHKTGIIFPSFFRSNVVATNYCDQKCLGESYNYLLSFVMMVSSSVLGILMSWYLAFVHTKKVKNADLYNTIKISSILLIVVNFAICSKAVHRLQDPRFHTIVKIITDPELNQEQNKREIASAKEFLSEIKKQKN